MKRTFMIPFLQLVRRLLFLYLLLTGFVVAVFLLTSIGKLFPDAESVRNGSATTVEATVDLEYPHIFGTIYSILDDVVLGWADGKAAGSRPTSDRESSKIKQGESIPASAAAQLAGVAYQLLPDKHRQIWRYQETSLWKQLVLLHLGVTDSKMSLGLGAYMFLSVLLLYRILRDVTPQTPFTVANARRIWWLGALLILADAYQHFVYAIIPLLMPPLQQPDSGKMLSHYVVLTPDMRYGSWAIGLMVLIIAAVYRRGVEITQEAELTV